MQQEIIISEDGNNGKQSNYLIVTKPRPTFCVMYYLYKCSLNHSNFDKFEEFIGIISLDIDKDPQFISGMIHDIINTWVLQGGISKLTPQILIHEKVINVMNELIKEVKIADTKASRISRKRIDLIDNLFAE